MEKLIGKPGRNGMQVLLAHNPKYGKTYWFYFHYATMKKGK